MMSYYLCDVLSNVFFSPQPNDISAKVKHKKKTKGINHNAAIQACRDQRI